MKKWLYWKTLALLIMLNCFLGCGGDEVADDVRDDGSITDSVLDDGTQVPTLTIEEIRSEVINERGGRKVWWRINANPPPKTDLAVRIFYDDFRPVSGNWVIVPKHKNESEIFTFHVWIFGDTVIRVEPLPMVSIVGKGVVVDLEALQKGLPVESLGGHRIPEGFDFPVYDVGEPSQLFFQGIDPPPPDIEPDIEPPFVTGGNVSDGDADVDPAEINEGGIEITFSEEVHGFIALHTEWGDDIGWIGAVDGMTATLKRVAGKELSNKTTYVIAGRVFDAARNKLTFEITFTTRQKE